MVQYLNNSFDSWPRETQNRVRITPPSYSSTTAVELYSTQSTGLKFLHVFPRLRTFYLSESVMLTPGKKQGTILAEETLLQQRRAGPERGSKREKRVNARMRLER